MANQNIGKKARMKRNNQKKIDQMFGKLFVMNVIIIILIVCAVFMKSCEKNKIEGRAIYAVYESNHNENDNHNAVVLPANDLLKFYK